MLMAAYDPAVHDAGSLRFWICAGSPIPGKALEIRSSTPGFTAAIYGSNGVPAQTNGAGPPPRKPKLKKLRLALVISGYSAIAG